MEAANRWETEAIRESRDRRRARPTVSQQRTTASRDGDWRTLREVSDETGIPLGTLRKWCRRESVDSYLEFDGEQTLRMLEMGSVDRHAKAMGRDLAEGGQQTADSRQPEPPDDPVSTPDSRLPTTGGEAAEADSTMIVPVDAWNKMLTQLGNLHEAGQQLAEARERAGKAETEAKFLRERLAEIRSRQEREERRKAEESVPPTSSSSPSPPSSSPSGGGAERSETEGVKELQSDPSAAVPAPPAEGSSSSPSGGGGSAGGADGGGQASRGTPPSDPPPGLAAGLPPEGGEERAETTSFWRYVVRGWKGRRR